jgi:hypothetical protein
MITHSPRHRSGRAGLPHPAPTSGDDVQTHKGIGMADTCRRKPPSNETFHTVPRQVVALTASAQDCPPQIAHGHAKGSQCRAIHGHTIVMM